MRKLLILILALCTPAAFGQPPWKFDMGTEKSPVFEGFRQVTEKMAYTPDSGFGWTRPDKVATVHRDIPEPLGCDFVLGSATFRLDVPVGDYHVWTLLGDSGHGINHPRFWSTDYWIVANGQKVVSVEQSVETYYRDYYFANLFIDWVPGRSLWEKYFAKYDRPHAFTTSAPEGRIEIRFSGQVPVDAVVVYPVAAKSEAQKFVADLRERRRKAFDSAFRLVGPNETIAAPATTPEEEARAAAPTERLRGDMVEANGRLPTEEEHLRGYALFSRPCDERVYPHTRPEEDDGAVEINLLATPGEYEPASFTVWPLDYLKNVKLTTGEIRSEDGSVLPASAVEWSIVKYIERGLGPGRYRIEPRTLLPYAPRDLPRDVAKRYWLTVHVPPDQQPGRYRGVVTFAPKDRPASRIPVRIEVAPFKLVADPGINYGMYYYTPDQTAYRGHARGSIGDRPNWAQQRTLAQTATDLKDQADHGMNCSAMGPVWGLFRAKDGVLTVDESMWDWQDRFMRIYAQSDLTRPAPAYGMHILGLYLPGHQNAHDWKQGGGFSQEYEKLLGDAVREYYRRARAAQAEGRWPEVIYYASDELSNYGMRGVDYGLKYLQMLHRIRETVPGGFRICSSLNGPLERRLLPLLDIAIPNNGFPLNEDSIRAVRDAGCELWTYNIGFNRFAWGYYPLRIGAKGRLQWHYRCNPRGTCDPNNWLTSFAWSVVDTAPEEVLPSVVWENVREGVDDARYVRTLEAAIARARKSDSPQVLTAAERAQKSLDWIMNRINPTLSYYTSEAGYWSPTVYDILRRRIAEQIVTLEEAME